MSNVVEFLKAEKLQCFVNVYWIFQSTRNGKAYEAGELVQTFPAATPANASLLKDVLVKTFDLANIHVPKGFSVMEGEFLVAIEDEPGQAWSGDTA